MDANMSDVESLLMLQFPVLLLTFEDCATKQKIFKFRANHFKINLKLRL